MTHTKEQFKAKCMLRNLNPRQSNAVVTANKIAAMAKSPGPITRTTKKIVGMSVEDPDSSKDPVPKRPRGRPCKRPHREKESFPQMPATTTPVPAKKRGNPNWTKKAGKNPKNPTHRWTWEQDTALPNTAEPAKKSKPNQQEESHHFSRNLQHDKNQSPIKQGRASSTNIPNATLDNIIQLLENQTDQIAQQNMLLLDQIGQLSDIKKLLIGFKGFFDQATEVNIRYNRQTPTDTTHGTNQPYAGTSMEHPATNTNHGIDPGLSENRFNQSFNWNVSEKIAVSGKKRNQKLYRRHSGRPGGLTVETFDQLQQRIPERIIEHAVRGMLPKGRLGRALFNHLKIYKGPDHPHEAQKPVDLPIRDKRIQIQK